MRMTVALDHRLMKLVRLKAVRDVRINQNAHQENQENPIQVKKIFFHVKLNILNSR